MKFDVAALDTPEGVALPAPSVDLDLGYMGLKRTPRSMIDDSVLALHDAFVRVHEEPPSELRRLRSSLKESTR